VTLHEGEELEINGLGFKSANDCPHRDPHKVEVYYLVDGDYQKLGHVHPKFHGERWKTIAYSGFNVKSNSFKFVFCNDKANELQLGEIIFYSNNAEEHHHHHEEAG